MNISNVNVGMDISRNNITNTKASVVNESKKADFSQAGTVTQQIRQDPTYVPTFQEKALIRTIENANKKLAGDTKEFNFSIHEKTKQIMIKIIDKETKEVIKEVPPEKILDMVATMCEMAGLFIDTKK